MERSFNLVFIRRIFGPDRRDATDEEERLLAETVAEAWRAWLHWRYQGRRFVVEVLGAEETGDVIGVTFYEDRRQGGEPLDSSPPTEPAPGGRVGSC